MTINNLDKFIGSLWDWGILDGCFGKSNIRPMDVDGLIERHGLFLMLEGKGPGVRLSQGQRITFEQLVATGLFTVMIVWGEPNQPESMEIWHKEFSKVERPCDLEIFRSWVSRWYAYANGLNKKDAA